MQIIYPTLLLGLILSPLSYADCSSASKQAALKFINGYVSYLQQEQADSDQWVAKHRSLTPSFKAAYKKLVDEARKIDPEIGLGFDPIVDGQDFPEKFEKVQSCDNKSGVVLVSGRWTSESSEAMEIAIKPIKIKEQWLIDGAGVINIPSKEQAPR